MSEENNSHDFYYPDNLSAKMTFIGWDWWAAALIGVGIVISLLFIRAAGLMLPLLFTGIFVVITFKVSDTCIYKQIIMAANYFLADQMLYFFKEHEKNTVPIFYTRTRKKGVPYHGKTAKAKTIRKHP